MQESGGKNEKRAYTRPRVMGFYIQTPPKILGNPIAFMNSSLMHTRHIQLQHRVKVIDFIVFETKTAVRIRVEEQQYMSGWIRVIKDTFAESFRILGNDDSLELNYEVSEVVKQIFREMERDSINQMLINSFQPQIAQPSQVNSSLPGLIVSTDVSGNGSLRMMIPFVSMNPANPVIQSVAESSVTLSQQFPMFATDPNFVTPQRRPLRALSPRISGLDEGHVNAMSANAPRKSKRPLESINVQCISEESKPSDGNSPPFKRPLHANGVAKDQSYKSALKPLLVAGRGENSVTEIKCPREAGIFMSDDPKPKKSIDFNSTEDLFQLKEDCLEVVKKFVLCKDCRPWSNPSKFRQLKETEDPSTYQVHKKSHENRPPKVASILISIVPPILRRKVNKSQSILADCTESHREIIEKLIALINCNGSRWEGIYMLLPWPNMNFTRYCLDTKKPIHPSLNFIEAHRRILNMEASCAELLKFLSATIGGARKLLRRIAPKHLADAYAVLISEDGLDILHSRETSLIEGFNSSDGTSIIQSSLPEVQPVAESSKDIAQCILNIIPSVCKVLSPMAEKCKWLKDNRRDALTLYTPFLTELDWGMPLLGLFYSLIPSLRKLDNEMEAQTVLLTVMSFLDERADVYIKSIEPLLLYGSRLTQYTSDLHSLCQNFIELGKADGVQAVQFPNVGRFHKLDKDGMVVGFDGRSIPLGLHAKIPGREKWLLPFPSVCGDIVPDKNIQEICNAHATTELRLVTKMLEDLGIQPNAPILSFMADGNAKVKELLSSDSPASSLNLTSILPHTASLPDAWFDPDEIFAPRT